MIGTWVGKVLQRSEISPSKHKSRHTQKRNSTAYCMNQAKSPSMASKKPCFLMKRWLRAVTWLLKGGNEPFNRRFLTPQARSLQSILLYSAAQNTRPFFPYGSDSLPLLCTTNMDVFRSELGFACACTAAADCHPGLEPHPGPKNLLGCRLQACNACTCPVSKPKKESGVSNRDIGGLMDGGAYLSEARSWRTPQSLQQTAGRTGRQAVFTPGSEEGEVSS